jgi:hypothetical protein
MTNECVQNVYRWGDSPKGPFRSRDAKRGPAHLAFTPR